MPAAADDRDGSGAPAGNGQAAGDHQSG
jgi:hypothetical protein